MQKMRKKPNMTEYRQVVLVGHCGPDASLLRSAINRVLHGVNIVAANDSQTLQKRMTGDSVLLINRVLDGDFMLPEGVELIKILSKSPHPPAMILISNYPEAQDHAVAAGALRGFGKTQLYTDAAADILRRAIVRNGTSNGTGHVNPSIERTQGVNRG